MNHYSTSCESKIKQVDGWFDYTPLGFQTKVINAGFNLGKNVATGNVEGKPGVIQSAAQEFGKEIGAATGDLIKMFIVTGALVAGGYIGIKYMIAKGVQLPASISKHLIK